jgi:DNA-binding beta-propeller fold protein YncE
VRIRILPLLAIAASYLLAQTIPALNYRLDPNFPQLPAGWYMQETPGVAVDRNENVYILNRGEHSLVQFDQNGKVIKDFGMDKVFGRAHGARFDAEGNLWIADDGAHIVLKLDPAGRIRMVLGRKGFSGESAEYFNRPTDIAFAANGDFYISDGYGNNRVVKFSKDGKYIKAWGKKGTGEGEFNLPHTVAVDKQGRVYIGDRENRRLQIFDAEGKFLDQWKHVGSPWGLYITEDQTLWLCDGYNNRVLKLNLDGQIQGSIGGPGRMPGQFDFAHHISVAKSGAVYVTEIKNWRVQKFIPGK